MHKQLQQAVQQMDAEWQMSMLRKLSLHKSNQIRKWRKRITGKDFVPSKWMKHLFKWVRGPSLPVPSCIKSDTHGIEGFTVSLADLLGSNLCLRSTVTVYATLLVALKAHLYTKSDGQNSNQGSSAPYSRAGCLQAFLQILNLLRANTDQQQRIPERSVGGVPKRCAF